jgi:hypothetical protein
MSTGPKPAASRTPVRSEASRHASGLRTRRRHDEAVIQAEVQRLARALRPYGVLHRDMLGRIAGTDRWYEGGFQDALTQAERTGRITAIGAGFYRDADRSRDLDVPNSGRDNLDQPGH